MKKYVNATHALCLSVYRQVIVASPALLMNLWWLRLCVGIQANVG